ncbi:MAG: hypothetical protein ACK55I_09050, partial [bacterium]
MAEPDGARAIGRHWRAGRKAHARAKAHQLDGKVPLAQAARFDLEVARGVGWIQMDRWVREKHLRAPVRVPARERDLQALCGACFVGAAGSVVLASF